MTHHISLIKDFGRTYPEVVVDHVFAVRYTVAVGIVRRIQAQSLIYVSFQRISRVLPVILYYITAVIHSARGHHHG